MHQDEASININRRNNASKICIFEVRKIQQINYNNNHSFNPDAYRF